MPIHVQSIENIVKTTYNEHCEVDIVHYYWTKKNNKLTMDIYVTAKSYNFSGSVGTYSYLFGTTKLELYAGYAFPIDQIEIICKVDMKDIKHLRILTKSDFIDQSQIAQSNNKNKYIWIEPPKMTASKALIVLFNNLKMLGKSRVYSKVKNKYRANRHYIESISIDLSSTNIKFETWYIPIFVYQYCNNLSFSKNKIIYYKFINGFNGLSSGALGLSLFDVRLMLEYCKLLDLDPNKFNTYTKADKKKHI